MKSWKRLTRLSRMNKTDRADIRKRCLPFLAWFISLALLAGWAWVIWGFSAAPDMRSSSMSRLVCEKAADLWIFLSRSSMSGQERSALIEALQLPVRKLAHFTEYAVLGGLMVFHVAAVRRLSEPDISDFSETSPFAAIRQKPFLAGLGAGVLYAVSDEIHQLFVPGRACRAADVCIDSAGLFAGMLLCTGVISIYLNMKRRAESS